MSYGKIGLKTVNSGSPLRDAVGSLEKELIHLWNSILSEPGQPSAQTHTYYCMQEDQAYSKPVVCDSLYPMICRLLRHAQGLTLAEF